MAAGDEELLANRTAQAYFRLVNALLESWSVCTGVCGHLFVWRPEE